MTREEAIICKIYLEDLDKHHTCNEYKLLMGLLEQEPCEDCVSRQAVIDAIGNVPDHDDGMVWEALSHAQRDVTLLPSVTPAEKVGHWEWVQYDSNPNIGNWHCSECNRIVCGAITAVNPVYSYKYCPECGAKMAEPQESEDKEE